MGRSLNVLLVEDSPDDAELLELELGRGGLSPAVRRVETAGAMRAALDEGDWDVVLCDYNLPSFSADGALTTLHDSGHDLPFIILSGVVQSEDAVALLKRGAHDFLNKDSLARLVPAILREIREAVERTQRRRAEERVRILSLAVEQSPVSVVITDRAGAIEYVNPKFQE
ncbi:MAG TPA: response regulator, partial [Patescibacteria group bacterium]|nr:response regulator [Patescibacteria group bacterium]